MRGLAHRKYVMFPVSVQPKLGQDQRSLNFLIR